MKRLLAAALPALLAAGPAMAQVSLNDILPNMVGGGAGFMSEYLGSRHTSFGVAPTARVAMGGERFVGLYGPFLETNVIDNKFIQAGPAAVLRLGRSDAEDRRVRALGDLDMALELGGRVSLSYVNTQGIPFRARAGLTVTGDSTGRYGGVQFLPSASIWVPLSHTVFVGAGVAARFGSSSQNNYYFGVSQQGAAASGLAPFRPGSGLTHVTAWPSVVWRLNDSWAVGAGFAYTRLGDGVADSPIVRVGSRDNWVGGVGVAYTW